jgi:hypothetical protein
MSYPKEGFYILKNPNEPDVLVHGYHCTDLKGDFVFGFNTYDGGGLIPLNDLTEESTFHAIEIPHHTAR